MLVAKGSKTKHKPLQQEPELDSKFHSSPSPPGPAQESPSLTVTREDAAESQTEILCAPGKLLIMETGEQPQSESQPPDQAARLISKPAGRRPSPRIPINFFLFHISPIKPGETPKVEDG